MTERDTLTFHPVDVPEWEDEDDFAGFLAEPPLLVDDEATAREMIRGVLVKLPDALGHRDLGQYAAQRTTPLGVALDPDTDHSDYHLIEIPATLVVPEDRQIARMRLALDLKPVGGAEGAQALTYDLFPVTQFKQNEHNLGTATIDVSKALRFVVPALIAIGGVPGAIAGAAADCLGVTLTMPLKWTSTEAVIQSSNRNLTTIDWYIRDTAIAAGFDGYAIIQVPRGAGFTVTGRMRIELRRSGPLGRIQKARYESDFQEYTIGAAAPRPAAGG